MTASGTAAGLWSSLRIDSTAAGQMGAVGGTIAEDGRGQSEAARKWRKVRNSGQQNRTASLLSMDGSLRQYIKEG